MASSLVRVSDGLGRTDKNPSTKDGLPTFIYASNQYNGTTTAGTAVTCSTGSLGEPVTIVPMTKLIESNVLNHQKYVSYVYTGQSDTTDGGPSVSAGVWRVSFTGKVSVDGTNAQKAGVVIMYQNGEDDSKVIARSLLIRTDDEILLEPIDCSGYLEVPFDTTGKNVVEVFLTDTVAGLTIPSTEVKNCRLTLTCVSKSTKSA